MPKTIFGTTEKSNFILNMKKQTLNTLIMLMAAVTVLLPQLMSFLVKLTGISNVFISAAVYISGFGCLLVYLIVMLKGEMKIKENPSHFIIIALAVLMLVSYYGISLSAGATQDMIKTMLLGENGRYEGMLTFIAYFGIFLFATAIPTNKTISVVCDIFVGTGIAQCVLAVFQHIPGLDFMTEYADLPTMAVTNVMLSSGFEDSPIFFGTYLTLLFAAAFNGAIYDKSRKRAPIYAAAAVLAAVTGLFTSSIVPIIGMGTGLVISLVIFAVKQAKGGVKFEAGLLKSSAKRLVALTAAIAVSVGLVCTIQGIYLRDKEIAYYDSFYRLYNTYSFSPINEQSLYKIGWGRSIDMIKANPIFGIGADCMPMVQNSDSILSVDAIDKSYNEYLYTACTRGIASGAVFIALFVYALIRGGRNMKRFGSDAEKWQYGAVFAAVAAYAVQAFFSASTIGVAPMFWLIIGLTCRIRDENMQ